jgi:hypothetical protein
MLFRLCDGRPLRQDGNFSATLSKFCVRSIVYAAGTMKYSGKRNPIETEMRQIANR